MLPFVRRFHSNAGPRAGLFGIVGLSTPSDFTRIGQEVKARCEDILLQIATARPNAQIVQLMDDLSDQVTLADMRRHV